MSSQYTLYHLLRWTFSRKTLLQIFEIFFNDEINLTGDWRVALSEIIFPTKNEHIVNGGLVAFSLNGYEESRNRATGSNVISRPYNGEKLAFMAGTYDTVAQLLANIKRTDGLPNFSFREIKSSGKYEIIFGKYEGITFPSEEIPSIIGFKGTPDSYGIHIGYKIIPTTANRLMKNDDTKAYYGDFPADL